MAMPEKIYPRRPRKVYLVEHRKKLGLTQKDLADRLGCDTMTVSRWERGEVALSVDALAAISEAFWGDLGEPEDLFHHPGEPTPNQLLRDQSPDVIDSGMRMLKALRK